jgi:predicted lipoprotein with Yx(FWY)xxD motif
LDAWEYDGGAVRRLGEHGRRAFDNNQPRGNSNMKLITAAVLSLIATGAIAAPVGTAKTGLGDVLVAENGMTLYTFAKDAAGVSNCNDDCAAKWPPLFAEEGAAPEGDLTVIERADGAYQWAMKGMPLYFWQGDAAAGDTTGDGVGGVWSVARP